MKTHRMPGPAWRVPGLVLTLTACFCGVGPSYAAPADPAELARPAFHAYTDKDGLPQNVIECIAYDQKGYLWVGTQNGAAYYNGRRWTVVNMPQRTASNYVFTILAASDGSLWFGTQLAGLARLHNGTWETFTADNSGLPHNEVRSLVEIPDPSGTSAIWIGTGGGGVARYQAGQWTIFDTGNAALRSNNVRALAVATTLAGRPVLWVGTLGGGLARYENGLWSHLHPGNSGLPSEQVRCLVADRTPAEHPSLWVGTTGGGLAHYQGGSWTVYTTANSGLPADVIRSLAETVTLAGRRVVWVGTNGYGLVRWDGEQWTVFNTTRSRLPNNSILSLLPDRASAGESGLWIGTLDGGLTHYVPGGWKTLDADNTSLPDSQVWSLLQTAAPDGEPEYWFGTTSGLAQFRNGRWTVFNSRNSGLPNDFVLSLLETSSAAGEGLWIGSNGGGLTRFEGGRWSTFHPGNSGLPDGVVLTMIEAVSDSAPRGLWVGTESGGLARLQEGRWTVYNTSNSGLPNNKVLGLLETEPVAGGSPGRSLWVGTNGGLARLQDGQWTVFTSANSALPNDQVWGLRETADTGGRRHLWVGTAGGGAARLDPANPAGDWLLLSESTVPALPNDTVWQIREDSRKRLYLYTDKGIARLTPRVPTAEDPLPYRVYTFTTADGLPSNGCNQGASLLDAAGRLWVGTGAGAGVFDPASRTEDAASNPLYIERTLIRGRERVIPENAALRYNENNFQFEYSLLSYFRESDTRYRFQLQGFDAEPSDWTAEARKEYTNLGEGEYVFTVWARDSAGNAAGPVTRAFSIRAAPWRTWWAYGAYTLVLGAAVAGVYRIQTRRLVRRERQKAQLREAELRAETAEAQAQLIEAENRRKSEELEFARQLQRSMLPKQDILLDTLQVVGQLRTATEVGGDYYDFVKIDEHRYCIAIGDATGHGVGAGLVVGMVKTALLNSVLLLEPDAGVQGLMVDLNTTMKASLTHRGVGMCLGAALLDIRTMTVDVCSTGMPFPCLYESQTESVRTLEMRGPPLGFMKKIQPHWHRVQLAPNDRLIFLSDGFHERMNPGGECWGYETVSRAVGEICRAESDAAGIARRLMEACDRFAAGRETDDDMTVLVVAAQGVAG